MEPNKDVNQDSSPDQVAVVNSEVVKTPGAQSPEKIEEKVVPYERFKEVNDKLAAYQNAPQTPGTQAVDALDFIKLGKKLQDYSDAEIDFATEYAKSKSPEAILAALDNDMVKLAIEANRAKVEKERLALAPNSTQSESDKPKTLNERLASASLAEKEKILIEAGLYKAPNRRPDSVNIGSLR